VNHAARESQDKVVHNERIPTAATQEEQQASFSFLFFFK